MRESVSQPKVTLDAYASETRLDPLDSRRFGLCRARPITSDVNVTSMVRGCECRDERGVTSDECYDTIFPSPLLVTPSSQYREATHHDVFGKNTFGILRVPSYSYSIRVLFHSQPVFKNGSVQLLLASDVPGYERQACCARYSGSTSTARSGVRRADVETATESCEVFDAYW